MLRRIANHLLHKVVTPAWPESPVAARHSLPSWLYSLDDDVRPSERLVELALRAIDRARTIDLSDISGRIVPPAIRYPDVWPGEHYKLLSALVEVSGARTVVEVGTAEGMSALCLKRSLPTDGRVVTFDIIPWAEYGGSVLTNADFDGKLVQQLGDLADPTVFRMHEQILASADLLFIDAPKDGRFEPAFLRNLAGLDRATPLLVMFDDIRVWNMLALWRGLAFPKLDLTSFGHWSGTGLIEWTRAKI